MMQNCLSGQNQPGNESQRVIDWTHDRKKYPSWLGVCPSPQSLSKTCHTENHCTECQEHALQADFEGKALWRIQLSRTKELTECITYHELEIHFVKLKPRLKSCSRIAGPSCITNDNFCGTTSCLTTVLIIFFCVAWLRLSWLRRFCFTGFSFFGCKKVEWFLTADNLTAAFFTAWSRHVSWHKGVVPKCLVTDKLDWFVHWISS